MRRASSEMRARFIGSWLVPGRHLNPSNCTAHKFEALTSHTCEATPFKRHTFTHNQSPVRIRHRGPGSRGISLCGPPLRSWSDHLADASVGTDSERQFPL